MDRSYVVQLQLKTSPQPVFWETSWRLVWTGFNPVATSYNVYYSVTIDNTSCAKKELCHFDQWFLRYFSSGYNVKKKIIWLYLSQILTNFLDLSFVVTLKCRAIACKTWSWLQLVEDRSWAVFFSVCVSTATSLFLKDSEQLQPWSSWKTGSLQSSPGLFLVLQTGL